VALDSGVGRAAAQHRGGGVVDGDGLGATGAVAAVVGRCPSAGDGVVLVGAGAVAGLGAGLIEGDGGRGVAVFRRGRTGRGRHGVALDGAVGRAAAQHRSGGVVDGDGLGTTGAVAAIVGRRPGARDGV